MAIGQRWGGAGRLPMTRAETGVAMASYEVERGNASTGRRRRAHEMVGQEWANGRLNFRRISAETGAPLPVNVVSDLDGASLVDRVLSRRHYFLTRQSRAQPVVDTYSPLAQ